MVGEGISRREAVNLLHLLHLVDLDFELLVFFCFCPECCYFFVCITIVCAYVHQRVLRACIISNLCVQLASATCISNLCVQLVCATCISNLHQQGCIIIVIIISKVVICISNALSWLLLIYASPCWYDNVRTRIQQVLVYFNNNHDNALLIQIILIYTSTCGCRIKLEYERSYSSFCYQRAPTKRYISKLAPNLFELRPSRARCSQLNIMCTISKVKMNNSWALHKTSAYNQ